MKSKWLAALSLLLVASSIGSPAKADDRYLFDHFGLIGKYSNKYELRLGLGAYDTGIFSHHKFNGADVYGEMLFPSPDFLYWLGSPRPHIGVDIATRSHAIDFAYAGLTWDTYFTKRLFTTASAGIAVTTATNLQDPTDYKPMGCKVLFHLSAGIGYDITQNVSVQLYADHFSNAKLCSPDAGAESAGFRIGYRF
jgi:lipid A 3-O-deacylase